MNLCQKRSLLLFLPAQTQSDFYQDDYDYYTVSFFIPEGKIVAVYDEDGNVLRTIEKFKDIALPVPVRDAVAERFPNWEVVSDVYRVKYNDKKGAKQNYKLRLKNGECSKETPYEIVGNNRNFFFSQTLCATSVTISESVDTGR